MIPSGTAPTQGTRVGRNDLCPCGSGQKYKHCCEKRAQITTAPRSDRRPTQQGLRPLVEAAKKHLDAGRLAEAAQSLQEILQLDPNNPEALHDLGIIHLRGGRTVDAAKALGRAVHLRPSFQSALVHLVAALEPDGRRPEAAIACRKLSRLAGNPAERRYYLARALMLEEEPAQAEKELHRVLLLSPQHAGARHLLGKLLSERGMFDEAATHLSGVVDIFPNAFQQLSAIKRMTRGDRPLLDRVRIRLGRGDLDAAECAAAHFGLGKAFDDIGEYAEAIKHYDSGNNLRAKAGRLDRTSLVAEYDNVIKRFSRDVVAPAGRFPHPSPRPEDNLPVLIVGMPRSGTTLVEQILSSHPAVAAGGELRFWRNRAMAWRASGIDPLDALTLSAEAKNYFDLLQKIGLDASRVVDKNPRNFEVLGSIRLALPLARVIHCRRHPVDTCLSVYFTNFSARHDYAWNRSDLVFYYGQYQRLMQHWRSVFQADRFAEVDYEALITNREAETRRLVEFCGLDWNDACLTPEQNNRRVNTASRWQVRQAVYKTSIERWRHYEPWLGELRELLSSPTTHDV